MGLAVLSLSTELMGLFMPKDAGLIGSQAAKTAARAWASRRI
jgi:hypothetical protein